MLEQSRVSVRLSELKRMLKRELKRRSSREGAQEKELKRGSKRDAELGCERLTNQNFWLDESRASFKIFLPENVLETC